MGSLGIAPTLNCTHFPKIGFVVAGGGVLFIFYAKGINQLDNKRKNVRKKLSFMHTKRFLKDCAIPFNI